MRTELYFQVELRKAGESGWWHFARLRLGGDYTLFALLAGVRAEEAGVSQELRGEPKGLPEDVDEVTLEEDALSVDDEAAELELPDTCRREDAEAWVRDDAARFLHDGFAVTHPDFHSYSWATIEQLTEVLRVYRELHGVDEAFLEATVAMLENLRQRDLECRAVFWFGG